MLNEKVPILKSKAKSLQLQNGEKVFYLYAFGFFTFAALSLVCNEINPMSDSCQIGTNIKVLF